MNLCKCSETVRLASLSPSDTTRIGERLTQTLYRRPLTIWLFGDLGAGKTTLVQGFAKGLGLTVPVTSPTFALENRYGDMLLHIDLYRLSNKEAAHIIEESENFPGIRIVEWSERIMSHPKQSDLEPTPSLPAIQISLSDPTPTTRTIDIAFNDLCMPDRSEVKQWRKELRLPAHVSRHCDAVASFAKSIGEKLIMRGVSVRLQALQSAGELHDLLRFVNFHPGSRHIFNDNTVDEETRAHWKECATRYGETHEEACAAFLTEHGYPELAKMIAPHGLSAIDDESAFTTIEQKILFYADKRILGENIVSLDERFDDFAARYGGGIESEDAARWRSKTKELEGELFGNADIEVADILRASKEPRLKGDIDMLASGLS